MGNVPRKNARKMKIPHVTEFKQEAIITPTIKNKPGQPKLVLDEALIEQLASYDCTAVEIACAVGCHVETLYARFSETIKRGREKGNSSLKRKMFVLAMAGNVTLLIWLSKQRLGYYENPIEDAKGITFNIVINEIPHEPIQEIIQEK